MSMGNASHAAGKDTAPAPRTNRRRLHWGWAFFSVVALFYLLAEHRAHLFGVLPFLLLLACPLMHLFMHHGHGGHESPADAKDKDKDKEDAQ